MRPAKIGIIGAGNLAYHLANALQKQNEVCWIYNRSLHKAKEIGTKFNIPYTNNLKTLDLSVDFVIVAIKDDAIHSIYQKLGKQKSYNGIILHTSGSVKSGSSKTPFKNYGVLYPLQTFSRNKKVDFRNIPICISAQNEDNTKKIKHLASSISKKLFEVTDQQRFALHLAAVFSCNFSNHMYRIAEELLKNASLDFELLRPLIAETSAKVQELLPSQSQTGPASRNDQKTIRKHLEFIDSNPEWAELYEKITADIRFWQEPET